MYTDTKTTLRAFTLALRRSPFTLSIGITSVVASLAYQYGADVDFMLVDDRVWDGQVWRFVTSCFVHGDAIHLLFGLFWTAAFGVAVERWCGPRRSAWLFLLLAVGSGAAQFVVQGGGIGLSGILLGYFGLIYATRHRKQDRIYPLDRRTTWIFVGWFFLCIALTETGIWHVGNIAHGAGALLGYIIGCGVGDKRPRGSLWPAGAIAVLTLASTVYMPWNYRWWWHRGSRQHDAAGLTVAYDSFLQAVRTAPTDFEVERLLLLLGREWWREQGWTDAVYFLDRGVRVSGDPKPWLGYLADAYLELGDTDHARSTAEPLALDDLSEELLVKTQLVELVQLRASGTERIPTQPAPP